MKDDKIVDGTFAVPLFYLPKSSPKHQPVEALFKRIQWPVVKPRVDYLKYRFDAFCCLLWAVCEDPDNVTHTILNKSHYNIYKWPVPYNAMADTVKILLEMGWLVRHGKRRLHRNLRYKAPIGSPLLRIGKIKLNEHDWEPPIISIRRGNTDLDRAPLDVELMSNPKWRKWIANYLTPKMEDLNDKLLGHAFTLFPFGNADEDVQPQYQRIYTNTSGFKETPYLTHGRIYPKNFRIPSKKNGWRQKTLIDGLPTVEVDVHASSLTLLSELQYTRFILPNTDDYYQYGRLKELSRDVVKLVIQCFINGVSPELKTWPKSIKEDKKVGGQVSALSWTECRDAIIGTYPILQHIRPDTGMDLMLEESDIIIHAMSLLLDKGIGCLSLHDCLIVPEIHTDNAISVFNSAYEAKGYKHPKLKVG